MLFGEDAFVEDGLFLVAPVKEFVDALIINTWHRYRKGLVREGRMIEQTRQKLNAVWTGEHTIFPIL